MSAERPLLREALDQIETALQRVMPGMNWLEWVADEGEPAMESLSLVRAVVDGIPAAMAQAAVIGAKHAR